MVQPCCSAYFKASRMCLFGWSATSQPSLSFCGRINYTITVSFREVERAASRVADRCLSVFCRDLRGWNGPNAELGDATEQLPHSDFGSILLEDFFIRFGKLPMIRCPLILVVRPGQLAVTWGGHTRRMHGTGLVIVRAPRRSVLIGK